MADVELTHKHRRPNYGRTRQPLLRTRNYRLHLRRHGHADVRKQLQARQLSRERCSTMELLRLFSLVHDRLPCAVRRVDTVDVGLHVLHVVRLHTVLSRHNDHRKSRGKIKTLFPLIVK